MYERQSLALQSDEQSRLIENYKLSFKSGAEWMNAREMPAAPPVTLVLPALYKPRNKTLPPFPPLPSLAALKPGTKRGYHVPSNIIKNACFGPRPADKWFWLIFTPVRTEWTVLLLHVKLRVSAELLVEDAALLQNGCARGIAPGVPPANLTRLFLIFLSTRGIFFLNLLLI